MLFLPPGNETHPCSGVDAWDASRPTHSPEFLRTLFGYLGFLIVLFLGSIPILYYFRNDPRFRKIRPFSLSASIMVVGAGYAIGCILPDALLGFPCALILFLHVFGSAVATSVTTVRALVFVIESQYAAVIAGADSQVVGAAAITSLVAANPNLENISVTSSVSRTKVDTTVESEHGRFRDDFLFALTQVMKLGLGVVDLKSMSVQTLSTIKRRYFPIFFCVSIFPFLVYAISVLCVSAYRSGCTGCTITLEFLLTVLITPTIFLVFITRFIYLGRRSAQDEQQVMQEILLSIALAPHWIYIGYALELADPGLVSFNRLFSWQILTCIGPFLFWAVFVCLQVVKAILYRRERAMQNRVQPESGNARTFQDECAADGDLKREFYRFATSRYTLESINFLEDVKKYKYQFESQNERWRKQKAKQMINTYIRDSSPQQVNISASQREGVLRALDDDSQLLTIFDKAEHEITHMVTVGVWTDFKNMKVRQKKMGLKQSRFAASSQAIAGITTASDVV
jgi:hypothetical protein